MSSKNEIRRDDEVRHEGQREAPRARRRQALRLIVSAVVAVAVVGLSTVAVHRAEANGPSCRYTLTATTVLDNETGLTWQRTNLSSYNLGEAKDHCAGLFLGGQPGWRVPTLQELLTLVDDSQLQPAIDGNAFPGTPSLGFWSSTPNAEDPAQVWFVSFFGGVTDNAGMSGSHLVRCVR